MLNVRLAGGHLFGKLLFTWLSLVVSMVMSFCAVLFPTRCLGWDLELNWVSFWGFSFLLFYTEWVSEWVRDTALTTHQHKKVISPQNIIWKSNYKDFRYFPICFYLWFSSVPYCCKRFSLFYLFHRTHNVESTLIQRGFNFMTLNQRWINVD